MKKPIIKNWTKNWATALAVSGMLVMGACGESTETAEVEEPVIEAPVREDVAVVEEEEVEVEEVEAAPIENADPDRDDFPATYIADMDEHIREHEAVNQQITAALTDYNNNLDAGSTPDMYDELGQPLSNTDQTESIEVTNEQDTANVYDNQSNTSLMEGPDAYFILLDQIRADYSPESQQLMDDIINEYNTRRETFRGQPDAETGVYVSPEVDPVYPEGTDVLMEDIHENLVYPTNAAAAEIEGVVFVNFVVDESGNVIEANAVENLIVPISSMEYATSPLNPTKFSEQEIEEAKKEMMAEAIRVVKATSGQWEPGLQDGQEVRTEVQLPVVFDIERIGVPEDVPLQE